MEDPVPVMLLEVTEWMIILGGFGIGIVMRQFLLGILFAFLAFKGYRKLKSVGKRGAVLHQLWRIGIVLDPLFKKSAPKPTAVYLHE